MKKKKRKEQDSEDWQNGVENATENQNATGIKASSPTQAEDTLEKENPPITEKKNEPSSIGITQRDFRGFQFNKGVGRLVTPLAPVLYFGEKNADRDLVVAVPAKVQTWLINESFVTSVVHLLPDFDDRVNTLTYDLSDAVLQEARNRGRLSREVLANIVGYLAKFRDFIGLNALARADAQNPDVPDQQASLADETDPYILVNEFRRYLRLGVNSGYLIDILESAFSPTEANAILAMAIENVDRYLVRGVLNPAVMRFALQDHISASADWATLVQSLNLPDAESAIRELQSLYYYAATSRTLDALGNRITDISAGSRPLSSLIQIFNVFAKFDGPLVHLPVQDVIKTSLSAAGFSTDRKVSIGNQLLIQRLENLPSEFDVICTRQQVMRFYFALVQFYTRRSVSVREAFLNVERTGDIMLTALTTASSESTIKPFSPVTSFLPSYRSVPYFDMHPDAEVALQAEADDEGVFEALQRLFQRAFVRTIFTLSVSGEIGSFKNRLLSLMDERSLERSDVWNDVLDASLSADSIYFESWLRSSKMFYDLAIDKDIYYPGDSDFLIDLLMSILSAKLDEFSTAILPNSHPSSILEGANMTQVIIDYFSGGDTLKITQDWTLRDDMIRKSTKTDLLYDPVNDTFSEFYQADVEGGSHFDLPTMFPRGIHAYHLHTPLRVSRLIPQSFGSYFLADSDFGNFLLCHPDYEAIVQTGYSERLLRDGYLEWTLYFSPDDIATRMHLPLPLAQSLWNNALGHIGTELRYVLTYTGPKMRFLELPTRFHPFSLHQVGEHVGSTILKVPYPYQASRSFGGYLDVTPDFHSVSQNPDSLTLSSPSIAGSTHRIEPPAADAN